ncbi:MAG TPA: DUF5916 domain-containing protein [Candidatus Eisenbacteria bacterium]|nr:DUF5916 domain-containing protein [Candidatus Eisenbacteria bacterium]
MASALAILSLAVLADTAATTPRAAQKPAAQAVRLEEPVNVDGTLSESVWQTAEPFTALVQRDPVEGSRPSQRTEVRFAYDDDAFYVGARLYDTAPDSVVGQLARRDVSIASDRFGVYLDPYRDRRTGYYFMINAAGTLYDGTLSNDVEENRSWDGVWQGRARRDSEGWTVEMRIPYSQLRFRGGSPQTWGVNVVREIPRRREKSYAVYRPRKASGFVSRFPELTGIERISPRPAIELMPYVTSRSEFLGRPVDDPFRQESRMRGNGGGDLRARLGPLTLNATGNPDFGTVEIDPETVNLSDVEDFFEEKRPFFVEGASAFAFGREGAGDYWDSDWDDPVFFYSRRIGRAPQGRVPSSEFEEIPVATRILGAGKLIGRPGRHWTLGTLHAVTGREMARLANPGRAWQAEIEPQTYYGVTRAQREFGRRAGLGLLGTTALRTFDDPALRPQLNSGSLLGGLDGWLFLDRRETWVVSGWSAFSRVEGDRRRMIALQRSSTHYFQRPDAGHVEVDSFATRLEGWASRYWINKQKGAVLFNTGVGFVAPQFDVNDLGFQRRSDIINGHIGTGYKWTKPHDLWRYQTLKISGFATFDHGGNPTRRGVEASSYTEYKNGHTLSGWAIFDAPSVNNRRTRGGPLTLNPHAWSGGIDYSTDTQRRSSLYASVGGSSSYNGSWSLFAYPSVAWKPTSALSVKLTPGWERLHEDAQFVTSSSASSSPTYGRRYVFATLDQHTASASLKIDWTFTPRIGLQTYIQPFVSSAAYTGFKALAAPRSYAFTPTAPVSDLDFTVRSLKGNAVLRWEYRPGSTAYLVWTQRRSDSDPFADSLLPLGRVVDAPPENIFLAKLSWYFAP